MISKTQKHLKSKHIQSITTSVCLLLCMIACEENRIGLKQTHPLDSDAHSMNDVVEMNESDQFTELIDQSTSYVEPDSDVNESLPIHEDQILDMAEADIPGELCQNPTVKNIELGGDSPFMLNLGPCESPRLVLNLAQTSKWKVDLSIDVQNPSQDEAIFNTDLSTLDSWRLFDSLHWQRYLESESNQDYLASDSIEHSRDDYSSSFEFYAGLSGKHVLQLYDSAGELWNVNRAVNLQISLVCIENCALQSTLYPIVLVHGYAGVDQYFGLLDYFYRVPSNLRENGFSVFVPSLSSIELSSVRAGELSTFLDQAQTESGAEKFNLIAHSQGGLDSRFLISSLGEWDRIASLTTIATPHYGLPIEILDFFSRQSFSEAQLREFNDHNPSHPRVRYFSWSARTCTVLELNCLREHNGEFVTPFLLPTYTLLRGYGANDGLVMTESMIYGEHLGELSADHFDQIGQIADQRDGAFPHIDFYLDEARRLKNIGF